MHFPENLIFHTNKTYQIEVLDFVSSWYNKRETLEANTSGSTGIPKKIQIHKGAMAASARKTLDFFQLKPNDNAALFLSVHTIAGKMMIVRALLGQLNLHIFSPTNNISNFLNMPCDFIPLVPSQVENAIDAGTLKGIKTILVGGAPISTQLNKKLIEHKITVYQSFGMTETLSHIAVRKRGWEDELAYSALKNVHFSVRDNCLVIHSPDILIEDLQTNDIIDLISPTQFIWKGRKDFVINSGGIKLHPEEIENKLSKDLATRFFVSSIPDDKWGEKLVLVIEGKPVDLLTKNWFQKRLSKFEIPKAVAFCTFVLTESGKINRLETLKNCTESDWKIL